MPDPRLEGRAYKPAAPDAADATEDRAKVEWTVRALQGGGRASGPSATSGLV